MTTTTATITDEQIQALVTDAGEAGDTLQQAICRRALGLSLADYAAEEDARVERYHDRAAVLTADEWRQFVQMSRDDARAACARVIAHAQTQQ